jgi:serine/threonine protein phosphatase PrpC
MEPLRCPQCTVEVSPGDRFCEACGHDLSGAGPGAERVGAGQVSAGTADPAGSWVASAGEPDACTGCGGVHKGAEGFCAECGRRWPAAHVHSELDLGHLAAVTDRGKRHHYNEDAVGLAALPGVVVAVVCDGVSTSTRPDTASQAGVGAAVPALLAALRQGRAVGEAIGAAGRAAQAAVTLVAGAESGPNPPSSTFVCSVVADGVVTTGWVGDSRAYWLPLDGDGALCLTVDDAIVGGLVRWLGADAIDTEPHLRVFTPPGPGWILVCSDGLFRYWPAATDLAELLPGRDTGAAAALGPPLSIAQSLVRRAVDAGGHDNIAVAVLPYPIRGAE